MSPASPSPDRYLITGGALPDGTTADVLVEGGLLAAVGPDLTTPAGTEVLDARGRVVLPGLVDLHAHLRQPGREDAETVQTGTRAAALGGFTSVHAMANSTPVADSAGVVEQVWQLGREAGWCDVHPVGAVTVGLGGERLAELGAMAESRARVRVFSDDGLCVADPVMMRRALEYVKAFDGVIAQHAQEPKLTDGAQMNEGALSSMLGLAGWPAVAEEAIIARDVLLAQHVGSRLHVCHVSTAGSVEIIRWAKERGIDVTAEATPHHLLLTEELVRTYNPVYKVNPPLRREADVMALREGLADGTIDTIGTDHAPHTAETKECEWTVAAMGMTGLETALPVAQLALVDTGLMDWAGISRILSSVPARIARLQDQGRISPEGVFEIGAPAHLTVFDPSVTRTVDPDSHATKSRNSPYRGMELPGQVTDVFNHGHPVVRDRALATPRTQHQQDQPNHQTGTAQQ